METRHPGYSANLKASMETNLSNRAELEPRNPDGVLCVPISTHPLWQLATKDDITTSYDLLRSGSVALSEGLGPGSCSRISCFGNSPMLCLGSDIIFCNDVSSLVEIPFTLDELSAK
jgi:hypothetical protein